MPSKKLKLLTNQRKITDFKADFVPQNQNGPLDTPQTPSEDKVHETADVSDEKSSENGIFIMCRLSYQCLSQLTLRCLFSCVVSVFYFVCIEIYGIIE